MRLYRYDIFFLLWPLALCALIDVPYDSYNSKSVGNNLNELIESGTIDAGLLAAVDSLSSLSDAETNEALQQMQGSQYSIITEMQADIGGQLVSIFHRKPYLACCCKSRGNSRIWAEPFGNWLKEKNFGEEVGFFSDTGGIAIGFDEELFSGFCVGGGLAWDRTHWKWHEHRGYGSAQGYYGSIYTDYQTNQYYLGASFLAGQDSYRAARRIEFTTFDQTATASFHALDLIGQLAGAYFFGTSTAFVYPYATVDYLYLYSGAIRERQAGSFNLQMHHNTGQTLRTEAGVGFQIQDTNYRNTMCVSPMLALGWVMECPIGRQQYTTLFQGGNIPFRIKGWNHAWQIFSLDFGVSFAYKGLLASLRYNAETSAQRRSRFFGQRCNVHLEWRW